MNQLLLNISSLKRHNLIFFYKLFFYKLLYSKFFYFLTLLLLLKYDLIFSLPKKLSKPTRIFKYTVLRSPHVHKKSREQFEFRNFFTIMKCTSFFNVLYPFTNVNIITFFKNLIFYRDCLVKYKTLNKFLLLC